MDIEELKKELEAERAKAKAAASKAERLEEESKSFKSRAQQAEEKISEAEKAKLEEQGKLEELLKKEREEKTKLSQTLESRTQGVIREKLRAEIAKHAKDAHDVDMLLKVTEHKELLSIDEENLTVSGVKEFADKVKETHSYLFKKATIDDTENRAPNNSNKSENDLYFEALDSCTTRKELDEVKKKFGK